jgi:hypothetical protein
MCGLDLLNKSRARGEIRLALLLDGVVLEREVFQLQLL